MHGYKWPINCTRTRTLAAGNNSATTAAAAALRHMTAEDLEALQASVEQLQAVASTQCLLAIVISCAVYCSHRYRTQVMRAYQW